MKFKNKLILGLSVLGIFIGLAFAIPYWATMNDVPSTEILRIDETFGRQNFIYGAQAWKPYPSKLPITPRGDVNGDDKYYIMFVDLYATPNPNSTISGVKVEYSIKGLQGTAAFHVYGYSKLSGGILWTNRVDGAGSSGFYVKSSPEVMSTLADSKVIESDNQVHVKVSNKNGARYNDFNDNTYLIKFEKQGGGLNALHITTDLKALNGNVSFTEKMTGTFYATYSGDQIKEDVILMIAVNGNISDSFELHIRSSVM